MPSRARPKSNHDPHGRHYRWTPYPSPSTALQGHQDCVFNSLADLCIVQADMTTVLFEEGGDLQRKRYERLIWELYERLEEWRTNLPECLGRLGPAIPNILSLQ